MLPSGGRSALHNGLHLQIHVTPINLVQMFTQTYGIFAFFGGIILQERDLVINREDTLRLSVLEHEPLAAVDNGVA